MFYDSVKMGLSGFLSHQEIVDLLQNAGDKVIQTSDRHRVKSEQFYGTG